MAFPCVNFDINTFVDREDELSTLVKIISFSPDQIKGSDERVIHLVGKARIGKSSLLCKCHNHIASIENIQPFIMSFEPYLVFKGNQFLVEVLGYFYTCISDALGIQLPNITEKNANDLSADLLRELNTMQTRKNVVFLMDEINMLSKDQIEALEDYFLSPGLNLTNVVYILTGRHAVTGWKDFSLRPTSSKNVIELVGFNLENTQKQIGILNSRANNLASKIHEISGGSPGNNKLIVNQATGNPLQIMEIDALYACNQDLYDAVAAAGRNLRHDVSSELIPALEALCVLQDFDKDYEMPVLLAAHSKLHGVWDARRSAILLGILSGIDVGPGKLIDWDKNKNAYAIEEQNRFNLEQELIFRDKDLWKTLHCTAMKMYAQWATDYDSQIFTAKSEYHKAQLIQANLDPDNC